jgi:hypothetical protein
MFIIPFIHNQKTIKDMQVSIIQMLTIGGTTMWEEDDQLDVNRDLLEPNGLYLQSPVYIHNKIVFCPIDPTKTAMNDFYRWEETLPADNHDTFCWRTFYLFTEMQSSRSEMQSSRSEMQQADAKKSTTQQVKKVTKSKAVSKATPIHHMLPIPSSVKLNTMPVMELLQPIVCGSKHY